MVKLTSSNSKPNPIIEKIELTEQQKQEVQDLVNGRPSKHLIERWDKQGKRAWYERHYQPTGTEKDRLGKIRKEYFNGAGICMICHKLPSYKVLYKLDSCSLVEYYCESCFDEWNNKK